MIQVNGLTKMYGNLAAVDNLSFQVQPGEILGLVGPNGAGKTTTLRCIAGILRPSLGSIQVGGNDIVTQAVEAKRLLAFMPDEPQLFDYLTVSEHLQLTARIFNVVDAVERSRELLRELELEGKENALPSELSRGMRQKLIIACGLLHQPSAMLFDEPLTGLDPLGIRRMKNTIQSRAASGAAIVVSSHLLHLVEEISTRVLILQRGKRVALGTVAELAADFAAYHDASLEDIFIRATEPGRKGE
ncbi:MAG TPA: ABC transporter ATP-binding protein [Acidobacteriota bacterium]|jgi:ABC-2 type transport system ATP-binding protein